MPVRKQSVVLTRPDPGTLRIAIGNETMDLPLPQLHAIWDGQRDPAFLLWQFHLALQAANMNPRTSTPAQIKAAIEAQQYFWSN